MWSILRVHLVLIACRGLWLQGHDVQRRLRARQARGRRGGRGDDLRYLGAAARARPRDQVLRFFLGTSLELGRWTLRCLGFLVDPAAR